MQSDSMIFKSEDVEIRFPQSNKMMIKTGPEEVDPFCESMEIPETIFDFAGYFNPSTRLLLMQGNTRRSLRSSADSALFSF